MSVTTTFEVGDHTITYSPTAGWAYTYTYRSVA